MAKLDKDSGIFKLLFKIPKAACWVRPCKPLFIKTSVTPMENSNESNFFFWVGREERGDRGSGFLRVFVSLIQVSLVVSNTNNTGKRMCSHRTTSVPNKAGPS